MSLSGLADLMTDLGADEIAKRYLDSEQYRHLLHLYAQQELLCKHPRLNTDITSGYAMHIMEHRELLRGEVQLKRLLDVSVKTPPKPTRPLEPCRGCGAVAFKLNKCSYCGRTLFG